MALKKVNFKEDEEALFDNAVIYKRGEYWHMRMWLPKEHKYARFSLKTRNKSTAKDKPCWVRPFPPITGGAGGGGGGGGRGGGLIGGHRN